MPKTFIQLGQQLVDDAGMTGPLTSVTNQSGELLRAVNWIIRATTAIESTWFNWDFLHVFHTFNTIIGVRDYPAPANYNFWDNKTAKIPAQDQPLMFTQWTRRKLDPTAEDDGEPFEFTILPDKSIRLYDTPETVVQISIEYWKRATVMVNNSDEPAIPEQFRDIIVAKALQYYANYESAEEVKLQALEEFNLRMTQLKSYALPANQAKDSISTGTNIVVHVPYGAGSFGDEFNY